MVIDLRVHPADYNRLKDFCRDSEAVLMYWANMESYFAVQVHCSEKCLDDLELAMERWEYERIGPVSFRARIKNWLRGLGPLGF